MKMKDYLFLLTCVLMTVAASAQVQQGYVKTRGKMVNGQHIKGHGLFGATVTILNGNSYVVQTPNGSFSFPVPSKTYMLKQVQKKGYQLVDADATTKPYQYSSNPLYLVMETPDEIMDDLLDAQEKISKTLREQLKKAHAEIQKMKEHRKINEEEAELRINKLMQDQQNNQKLISEMAKEYVQMDYDQMNELNQRISDAIFNGRLTEAKSLLQSKGDMQSRNRDINQRLDAEAKREREIAQEHEELEESKIGTRKMIEDYAADCYKYFNTYKLEHRIDSAAYYIQIRADRDTSNVDWQNEAGLFVQEYLSNYETARFYYLRALHAATGYETLSMEDFLQKNPQEAERCWNNLGYLEEQLGDIDKSLMAYKMANTLWQRVLDKKNISYVRLLTNMGVAFSKKGDYDTAKQYYYEALDSLASHPGYYEEATTLCNNLGSLYLKQGETDYALKMFEMANENRVKYCGASDANLAKTYCNIAICKLNQKKINEAISYAEKANQIIEQVYGKHHPLYDLTIKFIENAIRQINSN